MLVEGPSERALLERFLPRFQPEHRHVLVEHQGKGRLSGDLDKLSDPNRRGLLDQLPAKLFQAVIGVTREDKVAWAETMGDHLSTATSGPQTNRSPSFQKLCKALRRLVGESWP